MTGSVGCGEAPQEVSPSEAGKDVRSPTWEEFLASAYFQPSTGLYIANGDEVFTSLEELRSYYDARVRRSENGVSRNPLIVNAVDGEMKVWSATQKRHLTYCVDSVSLAARYDAVVRDLGAAMREWESAADVKFVHLSQYDGNCNPAQENVLFDVREAYEPSEVCNVDPKLVGCAPRNEPSPGLPPSYISSIIAQAFFPGVQRSARSLIINSYDLETDERYAVVNNVLSHEVGHILGFRHEHIRIPSTNPSCSGTDWLEVTEYDQQSVMSFTLCGGLDYRRKLSDLDRAGARAIYGLPKDVGADFNRDGQDDLFLYNPTTGAVETRYGHPLMNGLHFEAATQQTWSSNLKLIPGDFNGDGYQDLFRYSPTTGAVEIRYGSAAMGAFVVSPSSQVSFSPGLELIPGDFNGDGYTDIFIYYPATGNVEIRYGSPVMTQLLFSSSSQQVWAAGLKLIPGDFNGDGYTDLFRYNTTTGAVEIRYGNSSMGALSSSASSQQTWSLNLNLVAGDYNGDGRTDLFRYNTTTGAVEIRYGASGSGALLTSPSSQHTWVLNLTLVPGDFNGDGYTDIFVYYTPTGAVETRFGAAGTGPLQFSSSSQEAWSANLKFVPADFNGDGRTDLFIYFPGFGGSEIRYGREGATSFVFSPSSQHLWNPGWELISGYVPSH
ncbi:FG-GAP-like repeat-containing protein [Myxococcus hansupus]|uniref:FG-GAP-like repeat-containing protein n=1 Tax=Pseudomyxococcus hansupus TaxID=1297742 RepID=UPI0011875C50|nr:FG-GAP-like repeat-containing protein [Myxococcus hansupus]